MKIDYEKWRDGIGYDLQALQETNTNERKQIETILVNKYPLDWRDIEALAILDTPIARSTILRSLITANNESKMAVLRFAPHLVSTQVKTRTLTLALRTVTFFDGFSITMNIVAEHHPPEIKQELFKGLTNREGEIAVHYAAMLYHIHGKSESIFDETQRSFFLKFDTTNQSERMDAIKELCNLINVDFKEYIK